MWDGNLKFRVFDIKNKKYLPSKDNLVFYYNQSWLGVDWFLRHAKGQEELFKIYRYTGYSDSNNSLIFEGDFLLYTSNSEIFSMPHKKDLGYIRKPIKKIVYVTYDNDGFNIQNKDKYSMSQLEWGWDIRILGNIENNLNFITIGQTGMACKKKNIDKFLNKNYISIITGKSPSEVKNFLNIQNEIAIKNFKEKAFQYLA
jgi:hypothetical protein